jgi:hypothetical protein
MNTHNSVSILFAIYILKFWTWYHGSILGVGSLDIYPFFGLTWLIFIVVSYPHIIFSLQIRYNEGWSRKVTVSVVWGFITLFCRLLLGKVAREENLSAAATHVHKKPALAEVGRPK